MNDFNLSTAHIAHGSQPSRAPWRWMSSAYVSQLLTELGIDPAALNPVPGRGGGTWVPRQVMTAYVAWLDPRAQAALVRGEPVDLAPYKTAGSENSRAIRGRLAGIEALRPGQVLRISADGASYQSIRASVSVVGTRLGRRFVVHVDSKTGIVTVTRKSTAGPVVVVPGVDAAPRRPDGWIDFDATNEQHAAWGSREAFEAAQTEALNAKNSADIDWT